MPFAYPQVLGDQLQEYKILTKVFTSRFQRAGLQPFSVDTSGPWNTLESLRPRFSVDKIASHSPAVCQTNIEALMGQALGEHGTFLNIAHCSARRPSTVQVGNATKLLICQKAVLARGAVARPESPLHPQAAPLLVGILLDGKPGKRSCTLRWRALQPP